MPRKEKPVKVERGLYLAGDTYIACVTPPGARRPRWRTLGKVGKMQARALREQFAVELRAGKVANVGMGSATFETVAKLWLEQKQQLVDVDDLAPRTFDTYAHAVNAHLLSHFGSRKIRTIEAEHLVSWQEDEKAKGFSAWTIKQRWTALRGILAYAARKGYIESSPADKLTRRELPKAGRARHRFLADDEIKRLLDHAPARYRPFVAVGLFSGLRIGEILGLAWRDIDFTEGVIRVRYQLGQDGKRVKLKTAAAQRDVVMMPALAQTLRKLKAASAYSQPSHAVFTTETGTTLSVRNAHRAFFKIVTPPAPSKKAKRTSANLPGVTPHTLRHTFASMLIGQGNDPVFVADQLGHEDPSVTLNTYAHLFRAAAQAAAARDQLEDDYGAMLKGAR